MSGLEARYRRLLRAYPAWYRQDRGEEMLDTLMEAAGTARSWPSARDTRALVLGGLRTRAWHGQRQTAAASLRTVVLFAAVLTLLPWTTFGLSLVSAEWGRILPSVLDNWVYLGFGLLTLAVAAGAWFGHPRAIAAVALPLAFLWIYQPLGGTLADAALPVAALAVLTILVIRRERLPRSWLWLAAIVLAAFLLPRLFPAAGLYVPGHFALFAVLAGAIVWSVVDARPMAAMALAIAASFGTGAIRLFAEHGPRIYLWGIWLPAIIALTVTITGVLLLRRQATL